MNSTEQELEIKFAIRNLKAIENKLQSLAAEPIQPRVYERNLRFDRPDGSLTRAHQVLRLRQDDKVHLTYKGPAKSGKAITMRTEIEFEASDFDAADHFLQALGYEVSVMYEKFRAMYQLKNVIVTLDELPYGDFVEIEGPSETAIRRTAQILGLNWEARITASYLALFDLLKTSRHLSAHNLNFDEVKKSEITPFDLGVQFGDPLPET
ncbi:MAG: class IV adenylate cyclase [Anaerolineaceae bacterium]